MGGIVNYYSEEFKADAVKLLHESGRSAYSVAKDLGINAQTLRNWAKVSDERQVPELSRIKELESELKAEKRRNAELEMSVEILKKATAIFAANNRK